MRAMMALIGYVSVATVLSVGLGLAYLWQTQRLDDEKVFRIVALLHDVDIDGLSNDEEETPEETPDEEPSLDDIERYRAVFERNYEVKKDALKRGRQEFDYAYGKLQTETGRFESLAAKIGNELERQGQLATNEAVSKVVKHLEEIRPEIAKDLLIRTYEEPNGIEDVILLMSAIAPSKLKRILQAFKEPTELDVLHEIHRVMLKGGPQQQLINEALEEVNGLKAAQP